MPAAAGLHDLAYRRNRLFSRWPNPLPCIAVDNHSKSPSKVAETDVLRCKTANRRSSNSSTAPRSKAACAAARLDRQAAPAPARPILVCPRAALASVRAGMFLRGEAELPEITELSTPQSAVYHDNGRGLMRSPTTTTSIASHQRRNRRARRRHGVDPFRLQDSRRAVGRQPAFLQGRRPWPLAASASAGNFCTTAATRRRNCVRTRGLSSHGFEYLRRRNQDPIPPILLVLRCCLPASPPSSACRSTSAEHSAAGVPGQRRPTGRSPGNGTHRSPSAWKQRSPACKACAASPPPDLARRFRHRLNCRSAPTSATRGGRCTRCDDAHQVDLFCRHPEAVIRRIDFAAQPIAYYAMEATDVERLVLFRQRFVASCSQCRREPSDAPRRRRSRMHRVDPQRLNRPPWPLCRRHQPCAAPGTLTDLPGGQLWFQAKRNRSARWEAQNRRAIVATRTRPR